MRAFLIFLAALAFSSCDPSDPGTKKQGAHNSTAIIQILPLPFPDSVNTPSGQITALSSKGIIAAASKSTGINSETINSSLEIKPIKETDLLAVTAYHDDKQASQKIAQAYQHAHRLLKQAERK